MEILNSISEVLKYVTLSVAKGKLNICELLKTGANFLPIINPDHWSVETRALG